MKAKHNMLYYYLYNASCLGLIAKDQAYSCLTLCSNDSVVKLMSVDLELILLLVV